MPGNVELMYLSIFNHFKEGNILQSGKGAKLDFDHSFAFSTIFLKNIIFLLLIL